MRKKITLFMLAIVLLFSVVTVYADGEAQSGAAASNVQLTDIAKHWAKSAIEQAVAKGYVNGYPNNTFLPSANITRAEFIKMLDVSLGFTPTTSDGMWYRPYVDVAISMQLHDAADFTDYTQKITRLEIMRLTARALATKESYATYLESFKSLYNGDIPYTDFRDLKDKDIPLTAMTMGAGIVGGYPDHSAGFNKNATRAEAVVMIERMLGQREKPAESSLALNELKQVAETGSNAIPFGYTPQFNFNKGEVVVDHYNFKATVKRVYMLPVMEGPDSFFSKKFLWDRDGEAKHQLSYYDGAKGYVIAVLDVALKRDGNNEYYANQTYLLPSVTFDYQEPRMKYGYLITYSSEYTRMKKNQKFEAVLYGYYGDIVKWLEYKTNNASSGEDYEILRMTNF